MKAIKKEYNVLMKRLMVTVLSLFVGGFMLSAPAFGEEMSNYDLMMELKAMKVRMNTLEKELNKKDKKIEDLKTNTEKRIEDITLHPEERLPMKPEAADGDVKWSDRIEFSGLIEGEFSSEKQTMKNPDRETRDDDFSLAKVELGIEVLINKYTTGNVVLLYEDNEDEDRLRLDEATIIIGGIEETYGLYFLGGKYYPHFGELNSYFVSDPLNVEIFEIRESAAQIGYEGDWFAAGAGAFHGDVQKIGDDESRINGFFADAHFHNPEDTLGGLSLVVGASYLNNVADTNLQDEVVGIKDYVGGFAGYFVAEYGQFSFGAEYISALDEFNPGEMAYAVDRAGINQKTKPASYNFEFAYRPIDMLQLALRYEGSKNMFALYPEKQYGGCISWGLFKYTVLSAEYLHGTYDENNDVIMDDRDVFTVQLAVEF